MSPCIHASKLLQLAHSEDLADCKSIGNDGPWSTFNIAVGSPLQSVNVLPATGSPQTLVVLPQGCPPNITAVYSDCASARGRLFAPGQSSTWRDGGIGDITTLQALNVSRPADFGTDTVALGSTGAADVVIHQAVGGVNALEYWLGEIGLGSDDDAAQPGQPGILSSLRNMSIIRSRSYGYTAGNRYRKRFRAGGVFG